MAGLNLGIMGGVKASSSVGYNGSDPTAGGTASQQAFGPGYTQSGTPSKAATFAPNDPFGVGFWMAVAAVAGLLIIRHSLPR